MPGTIAGPELGLPALASVQDGAHAKCWRSGWSGASPTHPGSEWIVWDGLDFRRHSDSSVYNTDQPEVSDSDWYAQ